MSVGKLHTVVLDCPDPAALARFYAELTGLAVVDEDETWVTLRAGDGVRLAFQRAPADPAPTWPEPGVPQQAHLDIEVADIGVAEPRVCALGARLLRGGGGVRSGFRVYADPAGHPFCLVWGQ
ncbi:glyoxalase [Pilimelia terevasa]|uniref:Glyoxalase n=1 Tax=Pilimelia terevasa TaxID=53372 RepID=A0A8J3BM82_9ACTN|nr:VOC family protein [Pilimelia terevasa]GGK19326.1 glyoxalase [Pilimelia terevasa]